MNQVDRQNKDKSTMKKSSGKMIAFECVSNILIGLVGLGAFFIVR